MAQAADLVSLSEAKAWLNITSTDTNRDAIVSRLITQISRTIYNNLNRETFVPRTVVEYYDGNNQSAILLRTWPVISVSSLYIGATSIPAVSNLLTTPSGVSPYGYWLDPTDPQPPGNMQRLYVGGYQFTKGNRNVQVTYTTGYQISGESWTVPSGLTVTAVAPYGEWQSDGGVTYANGTALTKISTSTPSTGQYTVSGGVYTFASGDSGASVLLSYGYVPADITQCALEWLAYRWNAKDRPGHSSKSLGGQETVSFLNEEVPAFVAQSLQNFRRIVPC